MTVRALLAGAALAVLCGPAAAFNFTPRSFGTIFDEHFRLSGLRYMDHCGQPEARGYSCDYGTNGKDPSAFVTNTDAERDAANALVIFWSKEVPLSSHMAQLEALLDACSPEATPQQRAVLQERLLDQGLHQTSSGLTKGILFQGVRYSLSMDAGGASQIHVTDLRIPNMVGIDDTWGETVELK